MKLKDFTKAVFCTVLIIMLVIFGTFAVFAEDADGDGFDDITGEPVSQVIPEPEQPDTEPQIPEYTDEPYTEPVYTEPEPETEPEPVITEPVTEPVTQGGGGQVEPVENPTEEFVPPTLPKTVSTKQYTTNYTAGIISWICVGVGIIVVAVVMISTKVSGRKKSTYR